MHITVSLRSKRFRAKSKEQGFRRLARAKNGAIGESKNKKEGVGEGKEGNACRQAL